MSHATIVHRTRAETQIPSLTLFDTLHNSLVLLNTVPFLPIASLLSLAATNRAFRDVLYHTPGVFRYLDLTNVKTAQFDIAGIDRGGEVWRNVQLDENLTEDDFYSGPLRGVFSTLRRRNILTDVQTLILNGLSVTSDLACDIINDPVYSVRLLSLRDVKHLNHAKLRGALSYACRPSRPDHAPRLKALYVFGSRDPVHAPRPMGAAATGTTPGTDASISTGWNQKSQHALVSSHRQGDAWWSKKGQVFTKHVSEDWVNCLVACEGLIAFDAVLCRGPRHCNSPAFGRVLVADSSPAVASFAVPACEGCGSAPEGLVLPASSSPASLPLLAPPPILSSSIRAATSPQHPASPFVARCAGCVAHRYCAGCHKWWCETCYQLPGQPGHGHSSVVVVGEEGSWDMPDLELAAMPKPKARVSKSCWECGNHCGACIEATQRVCRKCCGGYCITHNEGSSSIYCDWCVSRGRGLGRL